MDLSPLSTSNTSATTSRQDSPVSEGTSVSHRGRCVAGMSVTGLFLKQTGETSDGPAYTLEALLFQPVSELPGLTVSGDSTTHLENIEKLVAVLVQFGRHHPFFLPDTMLAYAAKLESMFISEISDDISDARKSNILVSILLAYQYSSEVRPNGTILRDVASIDPDFFSQYLRSVELYLHLSSQPFSAIEAEQVQELYDLVQKTEFFPAVWLLIRLALNDENRYLFSPFFLPKLLVPFRRRPDESAMLIHVFSMKAQEHIIFFNKLDQFKTHHKELEISQGDVFMVYLGSIITGELVINDKSLGKQAKIPSSVQMAVFTEWFDLVNSRCVGGKWYTRNLTNEFSFEQLNDIFAQSGKKFMSKRQFKYKHAEMYKQHGKATVVLRKRYNELLNEPEVLQSPFLSGLIRLTQGLMYQCSSNVYRSTMISVIFLVNAAETGAFPLLHKDSGDIYFGFGLFKKAREQYLRLYHYDGLPESLKKRLESLIEICELNIPAVPEPADDVSMPVKQEKSAKARCRQRKKATRNSAALPKKTAKDAVTVIQAASISGQSNTGEPDKELVISTPGHKHEETPGQEQQIQDIKDKEALITGDEPAGFTTVTYASAKKAQKSTVFKPKAGNFGDHNFLVRQFISQVNAYRDDGDLIGEKACIERWLHDDLVYGRICEDATWFYLRQCISPIQMEPEVLKLDLQTMKQDQTISKVNLLNFALDWVARAMACYLQAPLERRVRSDQLKELLISLHERNPDKKLDSEACKRLRSGCSGFGHIFSEWSALVRNSKMKELHMQKGHGFFALKRIADPLYYQQEQEAGASFSDSKAAGAQSL